MKPLGRVAFAVKLCGHSLGKKDADRPVAFRNHVQVYHQTTEDFLAFLLKTRERFALHWATLLMC